VRPVKRGISMSQEMGTWIYHTSRSVRVSENKVIGRMLQIARDSVGPFDDNGLRRVFGEPWEIARKIPALLRQMRKRDHGHLHAFTSTRLSLVEKQTLRELAEKHKTTMSALQRQAIERILAKEN
jgi:hypothetical protein